MTIAEGQGFIAFRGPADDSETAANIMGCRGAVAGAIIRRALESGGGTLDIGAPEGYGLHVWEGSIETLETGEASFDGEWRRATADDLEQYGFPLSAAVERAEDVLVNQPMPVPAQPGFCCALRRKFIPGILAEDPSIPLPIDAVDLVIHWGSPTVLRLRFCPFCGTKTDDSQVLRRLDGQQ